SSPQKEGQNKVQAPPTPTPPQPRGERPPQRLATVITPLYRAVVSSEGGKLQELTLTYRGDKPMVIVGELGPGGLVAGPPGQATAVPMQLATTDLRLGPDRPTGDLVLTGELDGLVVTKTLTFHADTYTIDATVRLQNASTVLRQPLLAFPWTTLQEWSGKTAKFLGQHPTTIATAAGGELRYTDDLAHPGWHYGCLSTLRGPTKNGEQIDKPAGPGDWIALGSNWYTAALVARAHGFEIFTTSDAKPTDPKVKPATPLHTAIG